MVGRDGRIHRGRQQHRPRVPLPITIKTVVYTPDDSGMQNLLINRRALTGTMKQADALSETYLGNVFYYHEFQLEKIS